MTRLPAGRRRVCLSFAWLRPVWAGQKDRRHMSDTSAPAGFTLRTDAKVVSYPDRYVDERGRRMWETVSALLDELDADEGRVSPAIPGGYHG